MSQRRPDHASSSYRCARELRSAAIVVAGITLWISQSVVASPPKGQRQLELTFQVVDAHSGSPVAGALVGVVYPYPDEFVPASYATTGADGAARLSHTFFVGEELSLVPDENPGRAKARRFLGDLVRFLTLAPGCCFTLRAPEGMIYENTRHICYGDRWLEVSAVGYRPLAISLTTYTGEIGNLNAPTPAPVRVELHRGDPPANSLDDWAGEYRGVNLWNDPRLRILADGRFEWTAGGEKFRMQECGYAGICGDEIKFLLEMYSYQHIIFPITEDQRFIPVKWGNRRYLIDIDGMDAFCETVSQGKVCQIHFGRNYTMYARVGGDKSAPRGLPEVPKKWAKAVLPVVVDR